MKEKKQRTNHPLLQMSFLKWHFTSPSFRDIRLVAFTVVVILPSTTSRMDGFAPPIIIGTRRIVFCPRTTSSRIRISVANGRKVVVVSAVRLCFVMASHVCAVLFDIATLVPCALCEGKRRCHHCDDQDDE